MIHLLAALSMVNTDADQFRAWGVETLEAIRRDLYLPASKLYAEQAEVGKKPTQVAFNWPAGVMLSALAAGAKVEPKYKSWLREYADATRAYWNRIGPVPGYDVLPGPKPVDRYYDDNAWMCLALIETYEVLGDKKYLNWAEETFTYVWSGWDAKLGGGIYWRESDKKSKNTCSNAPSAVAAFRLWQVTQTWDYREKSEKIWRWLGSKLSTAEGLYNDNVDLTGNIEPTKWSYNTALPLRYAMERANATSHVEAASWFDSAKRIASAAENRWIPTGDAIQDDAAFAHLLFEALHLYNRSAGDEKLAKTLDRVLVGLHSRNRDEHGHYVPRWHQQPVESYRTFRLIDQASAARAFFVAALEPREE